MLCKVIDAMCPKVGIAHLAVAVLASVLLHLPVEAQSVHDTGGQVVKAGQLTKQQFKALWADQVVEVKGRRATIRELRAAAELRRKQGLAQTQARAGQEKAKFEARRAEFLQKQKATLQADNAKVRAQLAQLGRGSGLGQTTRQEIEEEARQLSAGSKTALPAEMAEIEKRAAELLLLLSGLPSRPGVRSKSAARQ